MPKGDNFLAILSSRSSFSDGLLEDNACIVLVVADGNPNLKMINAPIMSDTKPMFINENSVIGYDLRGYF
ncbi:MAG: hypothetical protein PF487_10890 [Bacteroidales bacterium]|jgi:hypothetical protein|nr:hypothetical protein [Bacteroidales bacterium]